MINSLTAKAAPLALFLGVAASAQLPPPATNTVGQDGVVQEPLRLCVMHNFNVDKNDPSQYMVPGARIAITQGPAGDNNFYGSASTTGSFGQGAIFSIPYQTDVAPTIDVPYQTGFIEANDASTELYAFPGGTYGISPEGGVVLGPDDSLYGTTYGGGTHASGTVFKIPRSGIAPGVPPPANAPKVPLARSASQIPPLVSFGDVKTTVPLSNNPQPTDEDLKNVNGGWPQSPLVLADDNNFYGVTAAANGIGTGTLFRVSTSGALDYRYIFMGAGAKDYGTSPNTLAKGTDGFLYGTTLSGGLGFGTIFQFDPRMTGAAAIRTLHKFLESLSNSSIDEGSNPNQLIQGSDGTLYGTTHDGGPYGRGVVFSLTQAGVYKVLHPFTGRESNPLAGLVLVHQKVPTVRPDPPLPASCIPTGPPPPAIPGPNDPPPVPEDPAPGPTANDEADYLYGVATMNGVVYGGDLGIIFRMRTDGSDFATVYNFDGVTGAAPAVAPVLANDNNLYGTTAGGGSHEAGVFYRLSTDYLVTGKPETRPLAGSAATRPSLEFQGTTNTHLWNSAMMQVTTDIAGYRDGQTACQMASGLHGILVRVKDPEAKVIQFFYRERLNIARNDAGAVTELTPIAGVTNVNGPERVLSIYSSGETYGKDQNVAFAQNDGAYRSFTSLADGNRGKTTPPVAGENASLPNPDPKFWALNDECNGTVHRCYPLTTDETHPQWIPDAEPPNDLYMVQDTQVDCDGIEIFDSPNFNNDLVDSVVEQRFTGITLGINPQAGAATPVASVIGAATWRIVKTGTQDPQYWIPSISGLVSTAQLKALHDILVKYGFTPDF